MTLLKVNLSQRSRQNQKEVTRMLKQFLEQEETSFCVFFFEQFKDIWTSAFTFTARQDSKFNGQLLSATACFQSHQSFR